MLRPSRYIFPFICLLVLAAEAIAQMRIDSVLVRGESVAFRPGEQLHLGASDDDLTFIFSSENSKHYRYRLEGFDNGWIASRYPVARYTNLKGGNYRLLVESTPGNALPRDTLAANRPAGRASLTFSIERELTEEWWFAPAVIAYVLLLLGVLMYFFFLYHFKQNLKVQAMRNRIAADLHDEVGATLSSIAMATNMVQRKLGQATEVNDLLTNIRADSEDSIQIIRDTVWTINPDNDAPEKLFEKMRSMAFQMLAVREIRVEFENAVRNVKGLKISVEQRRNVYLMFKETMNNIARHSAARHVSVRISETAEGICIAIEDDGGGFDPGKPVEGNGLRNLRNRAAGSFIDFAIDSAPGKGTRISMVVPEL